MNVIALHTGGLILFDPIKRGKFASNTSSQIVLAFPSMIPHSSSIFVNCRTSLRRSFIWLCNTSSSCSVDRMGSVSSCVVHRTSGWISVWAPLKDSSTNTTACMIDSDPITHFSLGVLCMYCGYHIILLRKCRRRNRT